MALILTKQVHTHVVPLLLRDDMTLRIAGGQRRAMIHGHSQGSPIRDVIEVGSTETPCFRLVTKVSTIAALVRTIPLVLFASREVVPLDAKAIVHV